MLRMDGRDPRKSPRAPRRSFVLIPFQFGSLQFASLLLHLRRQERSLNLAWVPPFGGMTLGMGRR